MWEIPRSEIVLGKELGAGQFGVRVTYWWSKDESLSNLLDHHSCFIDTQTRSILILYTIPETLDATFPKEAKRDAWLHFAHLLHNSVP